MEFGISIQLIVIVCISFFLVTASDHEKGFFDLSILYLYINSYIHLVMGSEIRNISCKITIADQQSTYENCLLSRSRK